MDPTDPDKPPEAAFLIPLEAAAEELLVNVKIATKPSFVDDIEMSDQGLFGELHIYLIMIIYLRRIINTVTIFQFSFFILLT